MVAGTTADRDRVVDLVRGGSLLVVLLGHAFMALVLFGPSGATLSNTLAQTPVLQPATWVLQIMPLFFAAGAWVNALSYRHATSYPVWLSARVRRLLRPVVPYIGFWILASPLLLAWNPDATLPLLRVSTQLLWFLGAYLLVTVVTPLLVRVSARPVLACAGWLSAAAAADVADLAGAAPGLRLLNFVLVWALAGQGGLWVFTADRRPSRSQALALAAGCAAGNALLVTFGPWPVSLVGLPDEQISNMAPPSVVMALHAITLAALVVAGYPALTWLAGRAGVWRATAVVNAAAMTIYLWHLVGMILALLTLRLLSLNLVGYSTPGWVVPRLIFFALFVAYTGVLVWMVRPFEHLGLPWWDSTPAHSPTSWLPYRTRAAVSVGGAVVVAAALLALSVTGLVGFPFNSSTRYASFTFTPGLAVAATVLGMVVVRAAAVGPPRPGRGEPLSRRARAGSWRAAAAHRGARSGDEL